MKIENKRKMVFGICLGVAVLLAGGSVLHAHFGHQWGHGYGDPEEHAAWICDRLTKQLDLDDSQKQQLEALAQDLVKKGSAFHQVRASGRQEVLSMLRADSIDRQRMEQLVAQHQAEISELISAVGPRLIDLVEMLSPEQRARLAKVIEDHHGPCAHSLKN